MTNKFSLLALAFLLAFTACKKDDPISETVENVVPSTSINKIMALGASRVEGARPVFESYRYELWKQLKDGGHTFDFVGTQRDLGSYPKHGESCFDTDHEGRGGWTSGQIRQGLQGWIDQTGAPDIVLFSSPGGNDALENLSMTEAVANINAVIDRLQAANPNVTILIEQMAPGKSDIMTSTLTASFEFMQQAVLDMATQQSTSTSKVIAIDMYTGFNDSHLEDDVHYNDKGAKFIADRYYAALVGVLQD